jgi:hypothetical protein
VQYVSFSFELSLSVLLLLLLILELLSVNSKYSNGQHYYRLLCSSSSSTGSAKALHSVSELLLIL